MKFNKKVATVLILGVIVLVKLQAAAYLRSFGNRVRPRLQEVWSSAQENKNKLIGAGLGWGAASGLWYAGAHEMRNYNPEIEYDQPPLTRDQLSSLGIPEDQPVGYVKRPEVHDVESLKSLLDSGHKALGDEVLRQSSPTYPYLTREGKFLIPQDIAQQASQGNQELLHALAEYYIDAKRRAEMGYDANTIAACAADTAMLTPIFMLPPAIRALGRTGASAASYVSSALGNRFIRSHR